MHCENEKNFIPPLPHPPPSSGVPLAVIAVTNVLYVAIIVFNSEITPRMSDRLCLYADWSWMMID